MEIQELIKQGNQLAEYTDFEKARAAFDIWGKKVLSEAAKCGLSQSDRQLLNVKLHFVENEYSMADSLTALRRAVNDTKYMLELFEAAGTTDFSENTVLMIIEKILNNFYLHIKTMYQMKPHGKGTIKKPDLDRITIGNEYDVQRILYSLLTPIFPEIRTEVDGDNGYSGTRADIFLNHGKIAIEIKCTRKNLTEKELIEQLGADGFHYQVNTLFMFVYDKACVIKNAAAFVSSFRRTSENGQKTIRAIVIQPISL